MCTVLATTADLMTACLEKNSKRFLKLYEIFRSPANANRVLLWSVQADWQQMVHYIVYTENAELHNPPYNLLCEAIRFNHKQMVKYILSIGNFSAEIYISEVIEAIQMAEEKCQHEIALYLLDYLLLSTTEGVLCDKYNFKISDNIRVYRHTQDYLHNTRRIRQVNYYLPV
jgi:hypothetical protein